MHIALQDEKRGAQARRLARAGKARMPRTKIECCGPARTPCPRCPPGTRSNSKWRHCRSPHWRSGTNRCIRGRGSAPCRRTSRRYTRARFARCSSSRGTCRRRQTARAARQRRARRTGAPWREDTGAQEARRQETRASQREPEGVINGSKIVARQRHYEKMKLRESARQRASTATSARNARRGCRGGAHGR